MTHKTKRGKYHDWITDDGLTTLRSYARDGFTDEQIANKIGIHPSTLYDWKKRYPEIDEALKKGKEVIDAEVEEALIKAALGYEYMEHKTYIKHLKDGTVEQRAEKTKKYYPPDVTAMIFWLKNRKPESWRDKVDVTTDSKVVIVDDID